MRATSLVAAVLTAHISIAAAQGADCNKECTEIDPSDPNNPCGPHVPPVPPGPDCHCYGLKRALSGDLYQHRKDTKIEIYQDNVLHMWCHNSRCWSWQYCSLAIRMSGTGANRRFLLPAYNDCCKLPPGFIDFADMKEKGW